MFNRLSKLFGLKKETAAKAVEKKPDDPRFCYVDYGSLRLRQVRDQEMLSALSDLEISNMIASWSVEFSILESNQDYMRDLVKDVNTLHKIKDADLAVLGPIHSISYKTISDTDLETDVIFTNPNASSDIKINIISDIHVLDDRSFCEITITAKDVLVLKMSIHGDYDRYTNVSHFIPGTWLSKFMPFIEHDFAHSISELATLNHQAHISKELDLYASWANRTGVSTDLKINDILFPVPFVNPNKTLEERLAEFEALSSTWKDGLKRLCSNNFSAVNLDSVLARSDNTTISTLLSNLNLKSITTGSDNDATFENPISDSGLELKYMTNSDLDCDYQTMDLFQNGIKVLSLYSHYGELGISHLTPGSWMETFGPMVANDFSKLRGVTKNLELSGRDVDDRTIASTMFDV